MNQDRPSLDEALDGQEQHWESTFSQRPEMFGVDPSAPALAASGLFKKAGATRVLELGGGQGRDTLFFARSGFNIHTLDYSEHAVAAIMGKAVDLGLAESVHPIRHDIRNPLPFEDGTFDACYSHMLLCMVLRTAELERLSREVWRILRPGGLHVFTVRHTGDAHYGTGVHHGEDMWEVGGFIVHFFSHEKVIHLAEGFEIVGMDEFKEGGLPRSLWRVTLKKKPGFDPRAKPTTMDPTP